jgi:hypothetical protein
MIGINLKGDYVKLFRFSNHIVVTESNTSNLSISHCLPKLEQSGDYHKILSGSIFLLLCRKIDSIKELDLAKTSIS